MLFELNFEEYDCFVWMIENVLFFVCVEYLSFVMW